MYIFVYIYIIIYYYRLIYIGNIHCHILTLLGSIRLASAGAAEIEESLLRPYPKHPLKLGHMIDWGNVLHYLVDVAKVRFGSLWPCHVAIGDSSLVQGILKRQPRIQFVCTVIYSISHWALVVYHVGSPVAVLVDGKSDSTVGEKATAFFSEALQKEFPVADCLQSPLVSRPGLE